jgi:hypothetical protein
MTERWLPVVGYEGLYEVSDHGRVRSMDRICESGRLRRGRLLACPIDVKGAGYRFVNLSRNWKAKKSNVHVLVLEAFVGPRPSERHEACHKDGDRANAALQNLRWDTPEGNHADRLLHGTDCRGEKQGHAVLTAELVRWIRESPQSSLQLAPVLGVASSTIRAVRLRNNWAHL